MNESRILFFDGAMGTMLQQRGLTAGEPPESFNFSNPDAVYDIHTAYLRSGADIIKSNTFSANSLKCADAPKTIRTALSIARKAVSDSGHGIVALDIGPTGKLLAPMGDLSFERCYDIFAEMINAGKELADAVLIETITDSYEMKAAILAAKENCTLPVYVTMSFSKDGRLLTGASVEAAALTAESLGADAIGFNCGLGPDEIYKLLPRLINTASIPVIVNPNAGLPSFADGKTVYNIGAAEFAEKMAAIAGCGVCFLGGCCGTTPEHISALRKSCENIAPVIHNNSTLTGVSSGNEAVFFGNHSIVIGERINPTGKKRFKQALRDGDIDYAVSEGVAQQEAGANILDVNAGLPEINEKETLVNIIKALQTSVSLPLQIDTGDNDALAAALRIYNGRPLINSVNGKRESMDTVFPLADKYGAVVIALTLDENGIPETADGRIAIARRIIEKASFYGIRKSRLVFDALTMAASADAKAPLVTIETVRRLKNELGVHTVLGVSNVSFGLPERESLNAAFYSLALSSGLSAAIINPLSRPMLTALKTYEALSGKDKACRNYIEFASALPATENPMDDNQSLSTAVRRGRRNEAFSRAQALLETTAPLDIINNEIIPAIDAVGVLFAQKKLFLPQLIASADAVSAAFEAVKHIAAIETHGERIVLATVKGDIHDIGKNIVRMLLDNYGYECIDMGRDVSTDEILRSLRESGARLLGLSALMTTTIPAMEETINAVKQSFPEVKIMVGGAVLTQEYADTMGADFWGSDAMASVRYANSLFEK